MEINEIIRIAEQSATGRYIGGGRDKSGPTAVRSISFICMIASLRTIHTKIWNSSCLIADIATALHDMLHFLIQLVNDDYAPYEMRDVERDQRSNISDHSQSARGYVQPQLSR